MARGTVTLSVLCALLIVCVQRVCGVQLRNHTAEAERVKQLDNDSVFRTLLESGASRGDAVEECVTKIKEMKLKRLDGLSGFSFPSSDFVPPGAQEWCECLVANPPATGSYETLSKYRSYDDIPEGLRSAYEDSFDYCRAQVLENSEYQTADICRGMFSLFGWQMNYYRVSFCGELCKSGSFHYDGSTMYYDAPEFRFNYGCADECARDAMPGYCDSTLLAYSGTIRGSGRGPNTRREITVQSSYVKSQFVGDYVMPLERSSVTNICGMIAPYLGSENECCNYDKSFEMFKPCCYLNGDGDAVFDCNVIGSNELYDFCVAQAASSYDYMSYKAYCKAIFDFYAANPQYDGTAKVYKSTFDEAIVAEFSDEMLAAFCSQSVGADIGACDCQETGASPFVVNCQSKSHLSYVGPVEADIERPDVPTPGAEDECHGLCGEGRDCVVQGNGVFCADCSGLVKENSDGSDATCCEYDADQQKCVTALKGSTNPGICLKSDDLFYTNADGDRTEAEFGSSQKGQYACALVRDMRQMGLACKVQQTASGAYKCYE